MADSFSSNFNLVLQVTGSNSGTWGTEINNQLISPLDTILGGTQPITMSGSNVTLTLSQWQNKAFKITGTLVASVSLILPLSPNAVAGTPSVGGQFIVDNQTTGNFALKVLTAVGGSTGVTVPQGARASLYSDTINVWYANDAFGIPAGVWAPYAGTVAPPGWLLCFGQSLLRAQYPALFNAIGTVWGSADGTHFNIPDMRGRGEAGRDDMGGVAANRIGTVVTDNGTIVGVTLGSTGGSSTHTQATGEVGVHGHGITDPGHTHTGGFNGTNTTAAGGNPPGGNNTNTGSSVTGIAINNSAAPSAMAWLQPTVIANKIIFAGA